MTFSGIIQEVVKQAARYELLVYIGDEYDRNVQANGLTGDFVFMDIPDGSQTYNDYTTDALQIRVLIQVLGTSFYLRNKTEQLAVLDRTFTVLTDMAKAIGCNLQASAGAIRKHENIYDSPKAGWEITLTLSE